MAIFSNRVLLTLAAVATGLPAAWSPDVTAADFALRDGDTVVFLGDSITAARTYGKIVENYTLLRFPGRKVHFHNAGWGGDTAAGGLKRLERDVFAAGADVLIVAYGVNDIGWGTKADEEHKKALPRRDPGHRRSVQGARGPRLHLLGGDHRRGPRPERARLPPGDVRRGHGRRPVAGRACHRRPAHDADDPAHGAEGERRGEAPGQGRRSTPPTAST